MSSSGFDEMFLQIVVKSTSLLVLATLSVFVLRRSSAAIRHRIWALTLSSLIALPLLAAVLPNWHVGISNPSSTELNDSAAPDTADVVTAEVSTSSLPAETRSHENSSWLLPIWLLGFVSLGLWIGAGFAGTRYLRRESQLVDQEPWTAILDRARTGADVERPVQLAFNNRLSVPMVVGLRKPVILLPRSADQWSDDRLERILVHELAHIQRDDNLSSLIGRIACSLFWFHPLVWFAAHRLVVEREHAADDVVLATGIRATTYAEDLLSVARRARPFKPFSSAALINPSPIRKRITALLDARRSHRSVSHRAGLVSVFLVVAATVLFACATPEATTGDPQPKKTTLHTTPLATFDADGAVIDLLGVQVPSSVERQDVFPMTLYWRVRTPLPENPTPEERWRVFVHFDGPLPLAPYNEEKNGVRFQADHRVSAPGQWWLTREVVEDRFPVMAGRRDFPTGRYAIYIGWFKGAAGKWTNAVITKGNPTPEGYGTNRLRVGELILR